MYFCFVGAKFRYIKQIIIFKVTILCCFRYIALLQDLGMDLVTVLDQLKIQTVVAMGDGAGANIVMQ